VTNDDIARRLRDHARALADRGDNLYRVRAFRQAAMAVLELREPVAGVLDRTGTVPGVGASVAATVAEYVRTGVWPAEVELAVRVVRKTPTDGTGVPVPSVGFAVESVA
jgi:holliday junction DNA helicase RuvA